MPAARPVILLAAASLLLTVPPTLAATVVANPSNVSCTGPTEAAATGQGLVSPAADGNGVTSAPGPVRNLVVTALSALTPALEGRADELADDLLDSHRRVRAGARVARRGLAVRAQKPVDLLGVYVWLPVPAP